MWPEPLGPDPQGEATEIRSRALLLGASRFFLTVWLKFCLHRLGKRKQEERARGLWGVFEPEAAWAPAAGGQCWPLPPGPGAVPDSSGTIWVIGGGVRQSLALQL